MNAVEAAALALVGSRFRLHGRDPASGLDCIGVVALAAEVRAPSGYALRGGKLEQVGAALKGAGWVRVGDLAPGDVVAMRPGPGQLHLGIRTRNGMVHADAGLRRVVERPGPPAWEVLGIWRRLS
ncbi:peptidoglycan endopeptidase [Sphingomonas sp.]|uniref:peptidoglycan endopeptidase n=1 Tax=Sphingomonas sp. TaxID=28214 RepID=UPI002DE4E631|nr:peptidoglycan endopeptidase [Sphingomonas sp.]